MPLQKQKVTKDQLHQLILERFGLPIFFQVSEDDRLGFRTTVVAATADLYELHSRLESICRELRPRYELVARIEIDSSEIRSVPARRGRNTGTDQSGA
jgi:hypothetical protein